MIIRYEGNELWIENPQAISKLVPSHIGKLEKGKLKLNILEALYLMDMRKFKCVDEEGKFVSFNELASNFLPKFPKLFAVYNSYRDWRTRGLFIKKFEKQQKTYSKRVTVNYPTSPVSFPDLSKQVVYFYPTDMISVAQKNLVFKKLFGDHWFGQFGVYKRHELGATVKFDVFETLFLARHCNIKVVDTSSKQTLNFESLMNLVSKNRPEVKALYEVYEDWRLRGYVIKTGFKFGSHFRIYFPGVSPLKKDRWIHSKHVLHVFPKYERMVISEWARAIRVAHSVRKTFVMGIPELHKSDLEQEIELELVAYHREDGMVINPSMGDPSYVILSLSEDEILGGAELATALKKAEEVGLDLLLAVTDRESDVTYYLTKKISLPGSKYEYYEIEWFQP